MKGELVSRTEGADATATTTFRYDSTGFRDRVTSPDFGAVSFEYTKFGELKTRTDGKGTTTWTYEILGRTRKRKDPDVVAQWFYDPTNTLGALKQRCYAEGATVSACAGSMMDPDFNEALEYNSDVRLERSTTMIRRSRRRQNLRAQQRLLHRRPAQDRRLRGNLESKASSVDADIGATVSAYHYDDEARPNRLSRATIGGREHAIHHDADGNVTR